MGVARNFAALGAHVAICGRLRKARCAAGAAQSTPAVGQGLPSPPTCATTRFEAAFNRTPTGGRDRRVVRAAAFVCPAEASPTRLKTAIDIDLQGSFHARGRFEQLRPSRFSSLHGRAIVLPQAYQLHGGRQGGHRHLMKTRDRMGPPRHPQATIGRRPIEGTMECGPDAPYYQAIRSL